MRLRGMEVGMVATIRDKARDKMNLKSEQISKWLLRLDEFKSNERVETPEGQQEAG